MGPVYENIKTTKIIIIKKHIHYILGRVGKSIDYSKVDKIDSTVSMRMPPGPPHKKVNTSDILHEILLPP